MKKIFITGIGTDVGKTLVSAIVVEALKADYWKPIQAGDLESSDTSKVKNLISNSRSKFHKNSYALNTAMSPHAAAEIDKVNIDINKIKAPKTSNILIIEGAGGLLVPLNNKDTILDLIEDDFKVIIVSRHYLGSINHTLLTVAMLKQKGIKISGIIYSGDKNTTTEDIINKHTNIPVIGRIEEENRIDRNVIKKYANLFKINLENL
ncbi:MAG: dethiobiotin synthase [Flavobacteriaceae bacterium]|nr:dethiobiotin synthase [Flavobacteriaceae bacterium]